MFRVLEQKKIEHQASVERTKELEKLALLEQKRNRQDRQRQTRLTTLKVRNQFLSTLNLTPSIKDSSQRRKSSNENLTKLDERRPSTPNYRPSSGSNSARHGSNVNGFVLPPSSQLDNLRISSNESNNSSSTTKVTLNDVYETLRKLEEVERFPIQAQIEDDSGTFRTRKEVSLDLDSSSNRHDCRD